MTATAPLGSNDSGSHDAATLQGHMRDVLASLRSVVVGKSAATELATVALFAGGHMLFEDVPGVGKTVLARTLAATLDASFSRVQGAPDVLPADITGSSVYDQSEHAFRFVPGPVFANVVLMDELNRTPPRSQAALLEAMEEGQVSVDGEAHRLPDPHIVIATQNGVDHAGTWLLPASQRDRFSLATSLGHPATEDAVALVTARLHDDPLQDVRPVLKATQLVTLRRQVQQVHVADEIVRYIVRLVEATRTAPGVRLGASSRAAVQLTHTVQALAAFDGRTHALPDDVKALAVDALAHRLDVDSTNPWDDRRDIIRTLLREVPVAA